METNKENLRELIEKYMNPGNAQMYLDDIEAGERILRKYSTPKPDDMLLANIKANIALHIIPQRTATFKKRVYEVLAVAASVIIIATISLYSLNDTRNFNPNKGKIDVAGFATNDWWANKDKGYTEVLDNYKNINTQLAQIEVDQYQNNAIPIDEFQKQIQNVKDHMVNMEYSINTQVDDYSSPGNALEELENQLKELSGSVWKDDYNNAAVYQ